MPTIGAVEMLIIAIVAIVVVGPKDLPRLLREFGRFTTRLRGMAQDFSDSIHTMADEADLADVRKSIQAVKNPIGTIKDEVMRPLDPTSGKAAPLPATTPSEAVPDNHAGEIPLGGEPAEPVASPEITGSEVIGPKIDGPSIDGDDALADRGEGRKLNGVKVETAPTQEADPDEGAVRSSPRAPAPAGMTPVGSLSAKEFLAAKEVGRDGN